MGGNPVGATAGALASPKSYDSTMGHIKAHVSPISIGSGVRNVRLWIGVVVGAALGAALAIADPPGVGIVLIGLSLWVVIRRKAGHEVSLMVSGVLAGIAVMSCVLVVAILIQQGSPTTGHGSGSGSG